MIDGYGRFPQVARDSHLARQEDAYEGDVGVHAAGQEQQVQGILSALLLLACFGVLLLEAEGELSEGVALGVLVGQTTEPARAS